MNADTTPSDAPSEDKPSEEQSQDLIATPEPSAKEDPKETLESLLETLPVPEPQRRQLIRSVEHTMMAVIEKSGQAISPETAQILAASADKDSDNKLKVVLKRLEVEDDQNKRDHEIELKTLETKTKFAWFIGLGLVIPSFIIGAIILGIGIYLCVIGKETLGASLVTGVLTGALSFIAGLGVGDFFKKSK